MAYGTHCARCGGLILGKRYYYHDLAYHLDCRARQRQDNAATFYRSTDYGRRLRWWEKIWRWFTGG